ncbi:amino acid ABC transporter permease [Elioraea tepida]|jgi:general L-amino acid transport system permease protein|uniref:Amino acid ABC transporter permease n=1 Tax=Elioraea tepida TaxID=2843330 RepID=A0A975YIK9_9PROT|nr:amino acid ABC transporter permease [Elioraea tepida]QXM23709.1 amino acid ABC transporter permease [Elioraea tepida]
MTPPPAEAAAIPAGASLPPSRERAAPRLSTGPIGWLRANLFRSWASTAVTLVLAYLVIRWTFAFFEWAVLNAVWSVPGTGQNVDTSACRALQGAGACWALIAEKYRFILFGLYPFDQQWRPAICVAIFIGLYVVSAMRRFWRRELLLIWLAALAVIGTLMWGGVFGLPYVPQERWGGLIITLILSTFGIAFAFPLSILVALGRRANNLPAVKALCVVYIELIRGVPLISLLFMASVMFPLFLPEGMNIDKLLRAQIAIILFAAAYLAEVVRGGLQALPRGQYEAAEALGLTYWQKTGLIILPQALRMVIPPLVNTFIGMFKDTSLVLIIGIFDLLNTAKASIIEPAWQGFGTEAYLTVAAIYFVFCFAMSSYSAGLEEEFNRHRRR